MPIAPPKQCNFPGCPNTGSGRFCDQHKREAKRSDRERGTAHERGYDRKWQKARRSFLIRNPICKICGITAVVVDHIVPHRGDMVKFWDVNNWQSLCKRCHDQKTQRGE